METQTKDINRGGYRPVVNITVEYRGRIRREVTIVEGTTPDELRDLIVNHHSDLDYDGIGDPCRLSGHIRYQGEIIANWKLDSALQMGAIVLSDGTLLHLASPAPATMPVLQAHRTAAEQRAHQNRSSNTTRRR